ncbi:methyltransferase [Cupriavidus sp. UYPR2.512]|uniref:methyltransferase n=1 Tax=Cupriavidus sp. UYPR2.512 TaxID=1080187 RepID=UPI0009D9C695|nr:hypothetical protein KAF44_31075 [Cupriavidus necator]
MVCSDAYATSTFRARARSLRKGTLAPWAPPVQLVVVGLYRNTRNPMYVSLTLILLGWAMSFGHELLTLGLL